MAAIGSLVFCTSCGNLLDSANGDENVVLTCDVCGARCKGIVFPNAFPVLLYKSWETMGKDSIEKNK
jgi:transcription elongation factor Elf1